MCCYQYYYISCILGSVGKLISKTRVTIYGKLFYSAVVVFGTDVTLTSPTEKIIKRESCAEAS